MPSTNPTIIAVVAKLASVSIGDTVTLAALCDAADMDITVKRWPVLQAMQELQREHGIAFASVRGIGYKRLSAGEGVDHVGTSALGRARNAARNGAQAIIHTMRRANDLSNDERRRAGQRINAFGLIRELTHARTVAALPAETRPDPLRGLKELLGRPTASSD